MVNLFDSIDDEDESLDEETETHIKNQITRFEEEQHTFNDKHLDKTIEELNERLIT